MGLIRFKPSRRASGAWEMEEMTPKSDATFRIGAPLARDTDESVVTEHGGGGTVTGLVGFAGVAVTAGVPAFGTKIPVFKANLDTEYIGQMINSSTIITPTAASHLGETFGMVKVSNEWYIDEADESNVVFKIVKIMPEIKAMLFKIISTVIAV